MNTSPEQIALQQALDKTRRKELEEYTSADHLKEAQKSIKSLSKIKVFNPFEIMELNLLIKAHLELAKFKRVIERISKRFRRHNRHLVNC